MKDELKKEKIRCTCGKWTRPKHFNMEGFKVRGSECPSCGEVYFNIEDANKVFVYNKIKKAALTGKVTKAGNSYVLRLPKALVDALGLSINSTITISVETPTTVKLVI
ncbi:MAG: AbrB/MazE/SpoVT family DNA-binding domain-containing protein [Euryarchaeota archaeon]|nr:AbrB/MazE/SpoVT family DNA-binding domain-containing protein [Euryarchaeota archaeon]